MTSKYLPLLIVDTRKVAVNNSMVGAEIQCSQVCSNRPGAQRTICKGKRKQALHNADCLVSITTTLTLLKRHSFLLEKHQRNKERNNNKQNLNTQRTFRLPTYSNFQPAFSLYLHLCNRVLVKCIYAFPSISRGRWPWLCSSQFLPSFSAFVYQTEYTASWLKSSTYERHWLQC